jgi:hypothetical protein
LSVDCLSSNRKKNERDLLLDHADETLLLGERSKLDVVLKLLSGGLGDHNVVAELKSQLGDL